MSREHDDRAEALLSEWHERRRKGAGVTSEEWIRAHPDVADELRVGIDALERLEELRRPESPDASALPYQIGEYRVLREIGRGGMGVVYEAEQPEMRRRVALKVLYPAITNTAKAVERFKREARAPARLTHTNIVTVHDLGEDRGSWYCAMELVEGHSLDRVLDGLRRARAAPRHSSRLSSRDASSDAADGWTSTTGGRRHFQRVAEMFAEVAEGLQQAHDEGIVHRDLKPANLMLSMRGQIKILDFGLARVRGESPGLTVTGDVVGTPSYMSPEQAGSRAVDARTDVYSLGATLYEVLTLRTPFHAKDVAGVLQRIRNEEPRAPRRLDGRVPRDLETIVLKAMEKDPARRYQSAGAIAQDLRHFAADAAIRARRVGLVERAWRGAKRHRALTSVVAVAALLAASAAVLGARAAREADARREMAYARLCNAAEAAQARGIIGVHDGGVMIDGAETDAAHRLLAEAIALLPDRPEAYFVRTLTRGSRSGRRADLEAARARGLGKRSCHLVQAWLLGLDKKYDQAKEEEQQARLCVGPASAADRYFDGRILFLRRQDREAVDAFTAAIRDAPLGGLVRTMSLYVRGLARERARDFGGAIEDAAAVRNAGDSRPEIRVRLASLWRRAGQAVRSEALFDDVLSDVRARGNVDEWDELCLACRASQETVWLDRASEEALRSFGNDPWIVRDRAMAYVDTNRHEEGLAVLAKASTSDLLDDDLRRWRGCMYLGLKRAEEALADFDQVLARFPRRVCALLGRGQAHEALYRDAEALAAYRAAVEADPYREDAHLALGSLLCDRVHDYDAAASEFREAIRLAPHSEAAHLFLGNALKNKRDVVGAVSEYREAIRCAPESALAHRYLGLALVAQGAVANALTEFREAIRLDPRSAEAHQDLASLLHQNGETDEAIAECREAVRLNPDDGELHGILGFLLGQAGDVTGKLLELREAVRLRPKDPLTHGRLGVALGRNGDNGGAIAELREAIRLEPGDPTTHFHLGIGLQTEGDADGAIAECREAIRLKPDYADAHASLGALLMNSRSDPEDALAEFDRCLAVDGRNAFAHRNRGQVLRALDRCEEALDAYDRALALDPACMDARIWHGLALERLERPDEALADYVRAEHDSPGHWKPPTWRAFVLVTLGRAAEALAATEHAIHLDGKNPLCREARWRALAALGRHEDALATCDDALRVLPDSLLFRRRQVMTLRRLGRATEAVERAAHGVGAEPNRGDALDAAYLCAVAGRATEARTLLKEGERLADREDSFDRARVFAVLAEWEHALHWLEIAATKSFHLPANHAPEPDFDFISGNPRFVAAMAKIVLP